MEMIIQIYTYSYIIISFYIYYFYTKNPFMLYGLGALKESLFSKSFNMAKEDKHFLEFALLITIIIFAPIIAAEIIVNLIKKGSNK